MIALGEVSKETKSERGCRLQAAGISCYSSGNNFQTTGSLELQEGNMETRLPGLSFKSEMTLFGQVFWEICSLEVDAAILKSADSFFFCFCTFAFWSPFPLCLCTVGCLVFMAIFAECKAYKGR